MSEEVKNRTIALPAETWAKLKEIAKEQRRSQPNALVILIDQAAEKMKEEANA